jgi:hypothetical protein
VAEAEAGGRAGEGQWARRGSTRGRAVHAGGGRGAAKALGGWAGGERWAALRSEQKWGREPGVRNRVGVKSPRFIRL